VGAACAVIGKAPATNPQTMSTVNANADIFFIKSTAFFILLWLKYIIILYICQGKTQRMLPKTRFFVS
jgi:hypothetical protein